MICCCFPQRTEHDGAQHMGLPKSEQSVSGGFDDVATPRDPIGEDSSSLSLNHPPHSSSAGLGGTDDPLGPGKGTGTQSSSNESSDPVPSAAVSSPAPPLPASDSSRPQALAVTSPESRLQPSTLNLQKFTHRELLRATRHFAKGGLLGKGGFGEVYRGRLEVAASHVQEPWGRGHAQDVAVKVLSSSGFQGPDEFVNEVNQLSVLQHDNLVRLIGYCVDGGHLALVYPLYAQGSLDRLLFEKGLRVLSWGERMNIGYGVAQGLLHLHQSNVIHRDLKPSNILLDESGRPVLADFGMARDGPDGTNTHISTRILGTQGYLDPAYFQTSRLTPKSDVYSFGVVLLELLTGSHAKDDDLTTWVRTWTQQQRTEDLQVKVDARLEGRFPVSSAMRAAILAKQCVNPFASERPEAQKLVENMRRLVLAAEQGSSS